MNRMLTILLVLSFCMVGLAVAGGDGSPTVYGKIHMSYSLEDNGTTSGMNLASNTSRIGVKGWNELNSYMTSFWKVESLVDWTSGGNTWGTYETFIGLKNEDYGSLLVGRHRSPLYMVGRKYDMFDERLGDSRNVTAFFGGIGWDNINSNTLMYTSPLIADGLMASLMVSEDPANLLSAAASYEKADLGGGTVTVDVGFEMHGKEAAGNLDAAMTKSENAIRAGVSYAQDLFKVNGFFQMVTYNTIAATEVSGILYGGSACYKVTDEIKVKGQFYLMDQNSDVADNEVTMMTFGADYSLAKSTTLYGVASITSNGTAIAWGNGMGGYDLPGTNGFSAQNVGDTVMGIGAGVTHWF